DNPAIDLDIDEITVGWADCRTIKDGNAAIPITARQAIELLVDHGIYSVITAMQQRQAFACRTGQQHAVVGELLVGELAEVSPAADLQGRGKPGVIFSAISPPLEFTDHERRIASAEIQSIAIAGVGLRVRT